MRHLIREDRISSFSRSFNRLWHRRHLAAEDTVVNDGVEQHEREYEEARSPEHEREAGRRRRCLVDGKGERNHIRPKRDR